MSDRSTSRKKPTTARTTVRLRRRSLLQPVMYAQPRQAEGPTAVGRGACIAAFAGAREVRPKCFLRLWVYLHGGCSRLFCGELRTCVADTSNCFRPFDFNEETYYNPRTPVTNIVGLRFGLDYLHDGAILVCGQTSLSFGRYPHTLVSTTESRDARVLLLSISPSHDAWTRVGPLCLQP